MKRNLPELAAPARRALQNARISTLNDLNNFSEAEIMALHGIGKNALATLKLSMAEAGLNFKQ